MPGRPRRRDERGVSESVQWAVLTPVMAVLVIGSIQSGIWLHGKNVVQEAAVAGAEAAAVGDGSSEAAREVGHRAAAGLDDVRVEVTSTPTTVTVTVEGRTQTFIDLGQGRVRGQATHPKEKR